MTTVRRLPYVLLLVLPILVLATGCSSPEADWKDARKADTVNAYQTFARKHPKSSLTIEATRRIEEKKWEEASRTGALVSYQKYLNEFPQGAHESDAKKRLDELLYVKKDMSFGFFGMQSVRTHRLTGKMEILDANNKWSPITMTPDGGVSIPEGTQLMTH